MSKRSQAFDRQPETFPGSSEMMDTSLDPEDPGFLADPGTTENTPEPDGQRPDPPPAPPPVITTPAPNPFYPPQFVLDGSDPPKRKRSSYMFTKTQAKTVAKAILLKQARMGLAGCETDTLDSDTLATIAGEWLETEADDLREEDPPFKVPT